MTVPAGTVAALAVARPLLLCLDIDGTLAPIVPRPDEARVPEATLSVLGDLAALPDTYLLVVTGRTPDDARRLVPVPGVWVVGNHGAETLAPDGTHAVDPEVAAFGPALRAAIAAAASLTARVPGASVEDKTWSASLHYRQVARADVPALVASAREAAERAGVRAVDGKEVVELRAPVAVDKGTAALALARQLGGDSPAAGVLAAGDDVSDEDLFRRLTDGLPGLVCTVRVGPAVGPTAARYAVPDPDALRALLAAVRDARVADASAAVGAPAFAG